MNRRVSRSLETSERLPPASRPTSIAVAAFLATSSMLPTGCGGATPGAAQATAPEVAASPAAAAPSASPLARTAPAGTRALARFELATLLQSPSASGALLALPEIEQLDSCDIDLDRDVRIVELAAGEHQQLRVDLLGPIRAEQVACALDGRPSADGKTFTADAFRIAPIAGGVRVATPDALANAGGAPAALVGRFEAAAVGSPHLLAVDGGSAQQPAPLLLTWGATGLDLQVTLRDAGAAGEAAATFGRALAAARKAGAQGLEGVRGTARGSTFAFHVEGPDLATALALRSEVVESFRLPSGSMVPTLLLGDHLLVLKGEEGRRVSPGDVIVFKHPESGQAFMKRVIAVGGERVQIREEEVRIDGKQLAHADAGRWEDAEGQGRLDRESRGAHTYRVLFADSAFAMDPVDVRVPAGHVYVLGDNRFNSHDSRQFGPVPMSAVIGRVVAVAASFDTAGAVRWERVALPVE